MAPVRAPVPHRRADAAALAAFLSGIVLVAACLTYSPIFPGTENLFGPAGDQLARLLFDALGLGVIAFFLGYAVWLVLYVAGANWLRLVVQLFGWAIFAIDAAIFAELAAPRFPGVPLSAFGAGGSIGSCLRSNLELYTPNPVPTITAILIAFLGCTLVAQGLIRTIILVLATVLNRLVVSVEGMLKSETPSPSKQRKPLPKQPAETAESPEVEEVPLAVAESEPTSEELSHWEEIPIIRHTEIPADDLPVPSPSPPEVSSPDPEKEATVSTPVPIHRHSEIALPTPAIPAFETSDPGSNLPEGYELPPLTLLADPDHFPQEDHEQRLRDRAALLEKTFADFGLSVKVVGIHTGPVITQYEIALETGLRLNKVTTLSDDLALNLGVPSVRIVAPLPGRNTVGLEVPNDHRQTVRLKELILGTAGKSTKMKLPIFLGKDVEGRPLVYDMADMPHLLIAGRTGTGKSVCLNAILNSFLFTRRPDECRLILIDPKKVEFSEYGRIPHLMHPVVTDDKKAEAILAWAVDKMEDRYEQLRKARVRNVASYNELGWDELVNRINPQTEDELRSIQRTMPYIVVVVDEVGDLLMTMKKEVESHIIRLAQKSRASGIHLILATQKPTVDVITGLIKSNLPARICFQVASRADSAVVLDEKGAEKLLGQGDMLFLQPRTSTIIRGQGAYVDDREIERVCTAMQEYEPNFESELLNLKTKDEASSDGNLGEKLRDRDPMYEQAIEIVIREQRGSTSLLQRALGIGYGRASRLIDFMAEDGIVGGFNGSNARQVLLTPEDWEARKKDA